MLFKYQIAAIFAVISLQYAAGNKFNISVFNLSTCEEYSIKSRGYTYADFFHLDAMKNNLVRNNERLHLKFYVMTSMDAHILLSETNNPTKTDRVYEIVFGAGGNTFSAIRLLMSQKRVATTLSANLLSVFDPMPVEIIQRDDGTLVVNIPNFQEPYLNYTDKSPLNISYVSFSSYGPIPAKWYYDCQFDGSFGEMEMESRPLSDRERLTADILTLTEPESPPPGVTEISFSFKVRSVEFDQRSSVLNTRLHLLMDWTDSRLKWDPSEYGNETSIVQPLFRIWHPILNIEDGALETFKKFHPFYSVRVNSDGHVYMFARNAEVDSWCFDVTTDWPYDVVNCEIILETKDTNVKLVYNTSTPLTDKSINELSEWSIQRIAVRYATYEEVRNGTENVEAKNAYLHSIEDNLKIKLTISRNSDFYHCVFTSPALVAESLILLAFFLEKYRRGGLNLIALLVICIAFMFIGKHAPATIVPDIVHIYAILMEVGTVTYILHVITIWLELYPPKCEPHRYVMSVINCTALRFILGMRFEDSTAYTNAQQYPWQEISKILNRTFFIILIIIFACINCAI